MQIGASTRCAGYCQNSLLPCPLPVSSSLFNSLISPGCPPFLLFPSFQYQILNPHLINMSFLPSQTVPYFATKQFLPSYRNSSFLPPQEYIHSIPIYRRLQTMYASSPASRPTSPLLTTSAGCPCWTYKSMQRRIRVSAGNSTGRNVQPIYHLKPQRSTW